MKHWEEYLVSDKPHHYGGRHRIYSFPNGFGASVIPEYDISMDEQYDEHLDPEDNRKMLPKKGWWEVAVIVDGEPCYTTPITDDVLRHQSDPDVDNVLGKISRL